MHQHLTGLEGNIIAICPVVVAGDAGALWVVGVLHEQEDVPAGRATRRPVVFSTTLFATVLFRMHPSAVRNGKDSWLSRLCWLFAFTTASTTQKANDAHESRPATSRDYGALT